MGVGREITRVGREITRVGAGSRGRRVCHKNEVSKDMEDVPYYGKGE